MTNLRTRSKNRIIKRRILKVLNLFKFKTFNLDVFLQIAIVGIIISIISLFFPWIKVKSETLIETYNAFSYLTGLVGIFIFLLDLFLLFIIISNKRKEKLKLNTRLFFRDNSFVIFSGVIIMIFSLIIFFFIKGLNELSQYDYGQGLVLSFVSSVFIIFSGIMTKRNTEREKYSLITNNSNDNKNNLENDRNMKLPFDY